MHMQQNVKTNEPAFQTGVGGERSSGTAPLLSVVGREIMQTNKQSVTQLSSQRIEPNLG